MSCQYIKRRKPSKLQHSISLCFLNLDAIWTHPSYFRNMISFPTIIDCTTPNHEPNKHIFPCWLSFTLPQQSEKHKQYISILYFSATVKEIPLKFPFLLIWCLLLEMQFYFISINCISSQNSFITVNKFLESPKFYIDNCLTCILNIPS